MVWRGPSMAAACGCVCEGVFSLKTTSFDCVGLLGQLVAALVHLVKIYLIIN